MPDMPKLLIIDDDPGIRNQLKWGIDDYLVYTACNRDHALEQFNKYQPAVVTLDLGLPPDEEGVTEGYEILNRIMEKAPQTKVIVVSGSEENANRVRAVKSGAFDFYAKPIDLDQLTRIIRRAFRDYSQKK